MEFVAEIQTALFWTGLMAIIWVNIILSGDNAVVIALAARSLPKHQQNKAVFWGAGAEFVIMVCGDIMTMPGLPKVPSAEKIDLNDDGKVIGLF